MRNEALVARCERLATAFKRGRTGQFVEWQPYIHGEQIALGLANIASYADDEPRVVKELERIRQILRKEAP